MYHYIIFVLYLVFTPLALIPGNELGGYVMLICLSYGFITATIGALLETKFPKLGNWSLLFTFIGSLLPLLPFAAIKLFIFIDRLLGME